MTIWKSAYDEGGAAKRSFRRRIPPWRAERILKTIASPSRSELKKELHLPDDCSAL